MANEANINHTQLSSDLMAVLAKHGVSSLPQKVVASSVPQAATDLSKVASYIREIITGDQAFDPEVLANVANVLAQNKNR
jgi:hypothetical protein